MLYTLTLTLTLTLIHSLSSLSPLLLPPDARVPLTFYLLTYLPTSPCSGSRYLALRTFLHFTTDAILPTLTHLTHSTSLYFLLLTHSLTYLPTYLLTYLPTYLLTYLPTYLPT